MIRTVDKLPLSRMELIQSHSPLKPSLKHNIKIYNQRFPIDFFVREKKLTNPEIMTRSEPQSHNEFRSSLKKSCIIKR